MLKGLEGMKISSTPSRSYQDRDAVYLAIKECGPVQRVSAEASAEALQLVQQLLSKAIFWPKTGYVSRRIRDFDLFRHTNWTWPIQQGFESLSFQTWKRHRRGGAGSVAAPQHRRGAAVPLAPHGAGVVVAVLTVAAVVVVLPAPHGGRGGGAATGAAPGGDGTVEGRARRQKRGLVVPQWCGCWFRTLKKDPVKYK